ncbi:MAG: CGNR zinc finger domain-containing protein [Roseiflexaceae bacterium]|nr:CGNR zinc finger domain-containing protein [Roseiflexaceae bacterium]
MLDTTAFFLIGSNLSVDFINTEIVENGAPKDLLASLAEFAAWAAATNVLDRAKAERLVAAWGSESETAAVIAHIQTFRSILRDMITGLAQGASVKATAIHAINAELQNKNSAVEIRQTESGFDKLFRADFTEPRQLLAPIAESAADLLCYGDLTYLKKCENAECILYFYDTTKNHSRRWCSMAGCGNRAKVAAFYQRQREKAKKL